MDTEDPIGQYAVDAVVAEIPFRAYGDDAVDKPSEGYEAEGEYGPFEEQTASSLTSFAGKASSAQPITFLRADADAATLEGSCCCEDISSSD